MNTPTRLATTLFLAVVMCVTGASSLLSGTIGFYESNLDCVAPCCALVEHPSTGVKQPLYYCDSDDWYCLKQCSLLLNCPAEGTNVPVLTRLSCGTTACNFNACTHYKKYASTTDPGGCNNTDFGLLVNSEQTSCSESIWLQFCNGLTCTELCISHYSELVNSVSGCVVTAISAVSGGPRMTRRRI